MSMTKLNLYPRVYELMESKGGKKKSTGKSLFYKAPLGYSIENVRPNGGIKKFRSATYSNDFGCIPNAASANSMESSNPCTLETCMTDLDREMASVFYKSDSTFATLMTNKSGIRKILPESDIRDFEFKPCGYSMNSIEGAALSTIHVTPEDGISYASFETAVYDFMVVDLRLMIERIL